MILEIFLITDSWISDKLIIYISAYKFIILRSVSATCYKFQPKSFEVKFFTLKYFRLYDIILRWEMIIYGQDCNPSNAIRVDYNNGVDRFLSMEHTHCHILLLKYFVMYSLRQDMCNKYPQCYHDKCLIEQSSTQQWTLYYNMTSVRMNCHWRLFHLVTGFNHNVRDLHKFRQKQPFIRLVLWTFLQQFMA